MAAFNTQRHFGWVTKTFHWLTVLLILTVIPLGVIANGMPFETSDQLALKASLFSAHKTVGVTIFFVAVLRILWAFSQPRPGPLNSDNRFEELLAEIVHWLLYAALVLVPLTGWIHHSATTGFAPIWWPFGQSLPFVPKSDDVAALFGQLHMAWERILLASLLLHIAGALKHHLWDRDNTLRRMLGTPDVSPPPYKVNWIAPVLAFIIYAAVAGAIIATMPTGGATPQTTALEQRSGDWVVQDGDLTIEVTQFGATVAGEFSEWTAEIAYDPDTQSGQVRVDIAIASLTLGSVTAQAMGADYFNAADFPTATFEATISKPGPNHVAEGQLTLKGASVPTSLAFNLDIDEAGTATMTGQTVVQRLDFKIGENQNDEANLGFAVTIKVALTAERAQSG